MENSRSYGRAADKNSIALFCPTCVTAGENVRRERVLIAFIDISLSTFWVKLQPSITSWLLSPNSRLD